MKTRLESCEMKMLLNTNVEKYKKELGDIGDLFADAQVTKGRWEHKLQVHWGETALPSFDFACASTPFVLTQTPFGFQQKPFAFQQKPFAFQQTPIAMEPSPLACVQKEQAGVLASSPLVQVDTIQWVDGDNQAAEPVVYTSEIGVDDGEIVYYRRLLYNAKTALYKALCQKYGHTNQWGSITGVHPLAILDNHMRGKPKDNDTRALLLEHLQKQYFVASHKASVLVDVWLLQQKILDKVAMQGTNTQQAGNGRYDPFVNLYVNVPFCPTRCSYCSFVTDNTKNDVLKSEYAKALAQETQVVLQALQKAGKKVLSIYVGGGT
ncbi:MAG: hypothetical protein FWD76_04995, partial [Firmicutes bacterium]|nr:hypothetical protein [Bacillota bacterium]